MNEENRAEIYALIPKVMAEIGHIGKSRSNAQQGYKFRGIDDVYNAIQPALIKHGVFIIPSITKHTREERQTKTGGTLIYTILEVEHRFCAPDGSSIKAVTIGEAMDSGDKSSNKAMSAAMKYACLEVFAVPTEGDNDTENHSHEVAPRPQAPAKPSEPTTPPAPAPSTHEPSKAQAKPGADYPRRPMDDDHKKAEGVKVESVKEKSGTTAKGKRWTVRFIKFSDGTEAATFNDDLAAVAIECAQSGEEVAYSVKPSDRSPDKLDLISIEKVDGIPF